MVWNPKSNKTTKFDHYDDGEKWNVNKIIHSTLLGWSHRFQSQQQQQQQNHKQRGQTAKKNSDELTDDETFFSYF